MSQINHLNRSVGALGNVQSLWQAHVWHAEDTSSIDIQWTLSQGVVEVDAVANGQVEESVHLLMGVVVGDCTSGQWPDGSWRVISAVDTGT